MIQRDAGILIKGCFEKMLKNVRLACSTIKHFLGYIYYPLHYYWHVRSVVHIEKQIVTVLDSILPSKGIIYLIQHSYFTFDGTQYISGGGERYASDLAKLIWQLGYTPVLLQKGVLQSKDIWINKRENLTVIGIPGKSYWYSKIIALLPQPKLAIYSGYVDFGQKFIRPNILISHGITWDCPQRNADIKRIFQILKNADSLVSVDTNTLSWLRTTYSHYLKNNPKEMLYIPNYVDWDLYKLQEDKIDNESRIRILFPRRLCEERGFWLVRSILPDLMKKYPNLIFDFAGFIHSEDIGDAVMNLQKQFPGRIKHMLCDANNMVEAYKTADIIVIPTLYSEGTSLSCIEAMACGKAIISTNIGGLTNLIINQYNGLLINPVESELSLALEYLIENPGHRKELGANARKVAEVFSKKQWDRQWIRQLQKI